MGLEWLLKTAQSTTLGHDVSHDLSKQRPCTPSCVSITLNYVSIRLAACRHACATAHDACRNYLRQATRAPQDGLGEATFGIWVVRVLRGPPWVHDKTSRAGQKSGEHPRRRPKRDDKRLSQTALSRATIHPFDSFHSSAKGAI